MDDHERRLHEMEIAAAHRAHDLHNEVWVESGRAAVQLALEGLRTVALINGGAVAAGLAFAGAIYDDHNAAAAAIVLGAVNWFIAGVILAGVATVFAYMAQEAYSVHQQQRVQIWKHPYVEDHGRSRIGTTLHVIGFGCVLASYACLIRGVFVAGMVVKTM